MGAKVYIPTPFRALTGNQATVEIEGGTVAHLIDALDAQFPGIRERVLDAHGEIHRHVNIYVNEVAVENLKGKETALTDGDEVALIPAIAVVLILRRPPRSTRYPRPIILREVGGKGQLKLRNSSARRVG